MVARRLIQVGRSCSSSSRAASSARTCATTQNSSRCTGRPIGMATGQRCGSLPSIPERSWRRWRVRRLIGSVRSSSSASRPRSRCRTVGPDTVSSATAGWAQTRLGPVRKQLNRIATWGIPKFGIVSYAVSMLDVALIRERFEALSPHLDERGRRLFAATEAAAAGYGGIAAVSRITSIAASTIGRGLKDLAAPTRLEPGRVRRSGGGRKALVVTDRKLLDDLNGLVEPEARGDPMSPLRWTCKSLRRVAAELAALGHRVSHTVVGELLRQQKFSLQANRKTREGDSHPDRDAQFAYINTEVGAALAEGQAVISVDTKKKELVGDFKNAGREWRRQGEPEEVRVHDFLIKELGRAVPYGICDLASNAGWVSVGITHDTAAFAVQTIRRWWQEIGRARYREATASAW